jgi:hypothetical protein
MRRSTPTDAASCAKGSSSQEPVRIRPGVCDHLDASRRIREEVLKAAHRQPRRDHDYVDVAPHIEVSSGHRPGNPGAVDLQTPGEFGDV